MPLMRLLFLFNFSFHNVCLKIFIILTNIQVSSPEWSQYIQGGSLSTSTLSPSLKYDLQPSDELCLTGTYNSFHQL